MNLRKIALPLFAISLGGCTAVFHDQFDDGTNVEFMTMSNLWSPNVTLVKIEGQEGYLAYNGSAVMNQAWTMGAGVAAQGYWIGDGIKGAQPDQTEVNQGQSQKQEGGVVNADINAVANASAKAKSKGGNEIIEINIDD